MNPSVQRYESATRFALLPLVSALMAALPLLGHAQSRIPVPATQLPVPAMPGWRVSGSGGAWAPVGGNAVIDQESQRAVYQWQSFNIGSGASMTFQFKQPDGSALNRVTGVDPSQIFGRLASTVPGADGKPVTGGTVLLINPNGILFGKGARVDTGALIASTLNVGDSDYLSGFNDSINAQASTFKHEGGAELFTDERSFVLVESGAQIATSSGGRIFLFAKNVRNDGSLSTPGGQTVLAGGDEVFLNEPGSEKLYASEANPAVPAVRGLLVEVGKAAGSVTNNGQIDVPRGSATLVGLAVNQMGRISATTSVSENGSVFLLARGDAVAAGDGNGQTKRAQVGGQLTLGPSSRIEITPDSQPGADGSPATIDGNASFTASRVELSGATVLFDRGATIRAPGAVVNVRAEEVPNYAPTVSATADSTTARIAMAEDAVIDVSGTTDTTVSVARNFVTTELLGASDLADSPLQRTGPLYRSHVTLDLRREAPILSEASMAAYRNSVRSSATERMSVGGSVSLVSQGAVVTHEKSVINVSGGAVHYTDAAVKPTLLIGSDGARYSVNDAPKDISYTQIEGASTGAQDRWGVVTQWLPQRQRVEPGYVQGKAAGSVDVLARDVVLDGHLNAATVIGSRQQSGTDALAAAGALEIGRRSAGALNFGSAAFGNSALLADFHLTAAAGSLGADFWADPISGATAAMPPIGRIAASTLNEAGFGQVNITSAGSIQQEANADIALVNQASFALRASGEDGIALRASIRGAGASVLAQTADLGSGQRRGDIVLSSASVIDTSGNWVNRSLDANQRAAVAGGSVQLLAGHTLDLQRGSAIDVSGGATVNPSGSVSGTAAGRIALESSKAVASTGDAIGEMHVGAALAGYGMNQGGSLRLRAAEIDIVPADAGATLRNGASGSALTLSDAFFTQGGFASFDVEGAQRLQIHAGAQIAPRTDHWVATSTTSSAATGARAADHLQTQRLPDALRGAANLSLSSGGLLLDGADASGQLTMESGARIAADAGAKIKLSANASLRVDGQIDVPAGQVTLALDGRGSTATPTNVTGFAGAFEVGTNAKIDVSGTSLVLPTADGTRQGRVLDAGSITLSITDALAGARQTPVQVAAGAQLLANGAQDAFLTKVLTSTGAVNVTEMKVGAAGGIAITAQEGGARIDGHLQAHGASESAAGGRLAIVQGTSPHDATQGGIDEFSIRIGAGPMDSVAPPAGSVLISAPTIRDGGFGDLLFKTPQRLNFDGSVTLDAARSLSIDAAVVSASRGSDVHLSAPALRFGAPAAALPQTASGGDARLMLAGGLVALAGEQTLQGIGTFTVAAQSRIELQGVSSGATLQPGALRSQADVLLAAPQTTLATATRYTIDAPDHMVTFSAGQASTAPVMSAGGELTVNARDILQDGVLRAPFGRITLNATETVTLAPGSVTSVSGDGLIVPVGVTSGGDHWTYLDAPQAALPEKAVRLLAPSGSVQVAENATLDLAGGGQALAFEFVPGPGGSKDQFAGAAQGAFAVVPTVKDFAPFDAQIAALTDASGKAFNLPVGRSIEFGAGGPIPAGTYAVLPARYALLPGAFLVTPANATARVDKGVAQLRPDGSVLVGASLGFAGTATPSASTGFVVRSADQARLLSEVRSTDIDALVTAKAEHSASEVPRLAQDAGALDIAARQLTLDGNFRFDRASNALAPQAARGGAVAISAEKIEISDATTPTTDALRLSSTQLNALGADTLTLGALRTATDAGGHRLEVGAAQVLVSSSAQPLQAQDVVLVATEQVTLADGVRITAVSGTTPSQELSIEGDGALVRASGDATAASVRTGAARALGQTEIGAGVELHGASLTIESTAGTRIADSAQLNAAVFTIGAPRIAVGEAATSLAPDTLLLSAPLTAQLSHAHEATLRSFSSIDFLGNATLGGSSLQKLTLDAGTLRATTEGALVDVRAGDVRLTNSSGAESMADAGSATIQIAAMGGGNAQGDLTLGAGSIGVSGASSTMLQGARSMVVDGQATLAASGDLVLRSNTLTATQRANAAISATQRLLFERPTGTDDSGPRAAAGAGATLLLSGDQIVQAGTIDLPSGSLTLNAAGSVDTRPAVLFDEGSVTTLRGRSADFDGQPVASNGGTLSINAAQGDIRLVDPALIDVSAGGAGAQAGDISLSAVNGRLTIDSSLLATSQAGAGQGGSLRLDSAQPFNLDQLAGQIEAGRAEGLENFGKRIEVRNRQGDQTLVSATTLAAESISLSSDIGTLSIAGTLDASGPQGGVIGVTAGGDLMVSGHLVARAEADGAHGGQVQLMSTSGRIHLDAAAVVDTSRADGQRDGKLLLRAARTGTDDAGSEVAVDALAGDLSRTANIEVEAVKIYSASTVNAALVSTIAGHNAAFGSQATTILDRLSGGDAALAAQVSLRSGVEVQSSGNLTVTGNPLTQGWNLTPFDADGHPARPGGQPVNLTLRAGGNLSVQASISDGFRSGGASLGNPASITPESTVVGDGGTLRLVGGADLSAANPLATIASADSGDVSIGRTRTDVIVRTSTGQIDIAAGRDIKLLNGQAVVYTTGTPLDAATLPGYVGPTLQAGYIVSGTDRQTPLLSGGGSISVNAQRDVVGANDPTTQYATDWWWRNRTGDVASWWSRYDKFKQGFGALGGGDVAVSAGRDAVQVQISAPNVGYLAPSGDAVAVTTLAGGRTSVEAGRDVLGGFLLAGGDRATVRAGANVAPAANQAELQVLYANTDVNVSARGDVDIGRVSQAGLISSIQQWPGTQAPFAWRLGGTAPNATLTVMSDAGSTVHSGTRPNQVTPSIRSDDAASIVPSRTTIAAPEGSVSIAEMGNLTQAPSQHSELLIAARDDIHIGSGDLRVTGAQAAQSAPQVLSIAQTARLAQDPFAIGSEALQPGRVEPVRLIAQHGDIDFQQSVSVAAPLRLIAGGDIVQAEGNGRVSFQHSRDSDLSLISAGGDIQLTPSVVASAATLTVHGPGDLVVLAGRDIDLGQSGGLSAAGNRENAALPAASARLTVLAGVAFDRGDYSAAAQRYVQLLGGNGVVSHAGELAAQLAALNEGAALPSPSAADAAAWNSLSPTARLQNARDLAGDAAFEATLLNFMRARSGNATLDLVAAQQRAEKLDDTGRAALAAHVVADRWLAQTSVAQQTATAATLAGATVRADDLSAFIQAQTGEAPADSGDALRRFSALPIERQLLHLNAVLASDLRAAGRAASALSGPAREAAYERGYDALATLFSSAGSAASLSMGASQIKTLQGSAITVLAPRGGINVGALTASSTAKSSSELGLVTTAGGAITLAVKGDVAVNRSRVFTVGHGDLLIWASDGNIDAGRGAKTVTGAPPPVYRVVDGHVVVDTSSSYAGSGIAVLEAGSTLDLYAPQGEINAGDAGIKSAGNAFLGAARFVGADNLQVGGVAVGAPPAPPSAGGTASLASAGQSATAAVNKNSGDDDEEERRRKRRARRDLMLDFLGFGERS